MPVARKMNHHVKLLESAIRDKINNTLSRLLSDVRNIDNTAARMINNAPKVKNK
ncbi:hypothetical protein D3C86_2206270 [compost metagenome]